MPEGMTYIPHAKNRFHVVAYDGLDPLPGKERRLWHPVGQNRHDGELAAARIDRRVQVVAEAASLRKAADKTRHKCFVSNHVADVDEVTMFLQDFGAEFIPRSVGVTKDDDFVDSDDTEYIKRGWLLGPGWFKRA